MIEEGEGICQKHKWREKAAAGDPLPWDSRLGYERRTDSPTDAAARRHEQARRLCQRCPILDACEHYLSDMERAGISVDGIVAGRYSDTPPGNWKHGPAKLPSGNEEGVQTRCRACRAPMWPQATNPARIADLGGPQHAGEGLCEPCFTQFARHVRKRC